MFMNRLFGKPKQETSTLQTLDKLNEVFSVSICFGFDYLNFNVKNWIFNKIRDSDYVSVFGSNAYFLGLFIWTVFY